MPKRLTLAELDARIEALRQELERLDHCVQLAHASGSFRKIQAAEAARQVSLRDAGRAVRQRQKLLTSQAEGG